MILIIAEKPSLARNIVSSIGKMNKNDGFYQNESYLVTWAFGHLFSLCDIEDYTGPKPRWTMENLPCIPKEFKYQLRQDNNKIDDGVLKQFNIIKRLCNDERVKTIVNAGDADREGEIIVRLCIDNALENNKELKRLWLPDQTPETINQALQEMKDESEYDNLANEGFARTYIDWLYGVNLTRYATLKMGSLLRVGRVIIPIVKAIYERDMAIKNFQKTTYYVGASKEKTDNEEIELVSTVKFETKEKAFELCQKYNNSQAIITSRKAKKDTMSPGKLYSLTKLQNVLGKKYKMSMEDSLRIVQGLYEKGYLTYPRTNSEYLANAEKDKIKQILSNVKKLGYNVMFKDNKNIFDDKKIESHSALTPTYKIPKGTDLNKEEMIVYQTVFRRFVAVFCASDCLVEKTEIKINVGDYEEFILKGMIIIEPGWTKYDDFNQHDKVLPNVNIGQEININFLPKEKETTPPKHYTIETLNNYLKNPFKEDKAKSDDEDDTEDYKAIFEGLELGTEATRTGIIDNAKKSAYIELKKDVYYILPQGEFLIESLKRMNISMDKYKTSTLGQALKKVYHEKMSVDEAVKLAANEVKEIFNDKDDKPIEESTNIGFYGDYIGICPLCGKNVIRGKYSYGCVGYKEGCNFKINMVICKREISISNAKLLLEKGETSKIKGFISKTNKSFDAKIIIKDGKTVFDF